MSFSQEVKEELATHISSAMHCKIAETAAILPCVEVLPLMKMESIP